MTAATVPVVPTEPVDPGAAPGLAGGEAVMRRHCVSTRVSPAELKQWRAAAGSGHQLGRWVRRVVAEWLAGGPNRQLLVALHRIGVNINQIARRLNYGEQADATMLAGVLAAEVELRGLREAVLAGGGLSVPASTIGVC